MNKFLHFCINRSDNSCQGTQLFFDKRHILKFLLRLSAIHIIYDQTQSMF